MAGASRSRILTLFKAVLGLSLLAYVLYSYFDFTIFSEVSLKWEYFVIMAVLYLLLIMLSALRWRIILINLYGTRLPYWRLLLLTYFGQSLALITPSRVGDLGRAAFLKGHLSTQKAVITLLYDKLSEVVMLVGIAMLGLLYLRQSIVTLLPEIPLWMLATVVIVCVITAILLWRMGVGRFKPLFKEHFLPFHILLIVLLISLVVMGATFALLYFGALVVGLKPSLLSIIAIAAIQALVTLIPVTIGGLGLREGSSVILFPLIGISEMHGILIAWIGTLGLSVVPAIVGAVAYLAMGGSFLPSDE